MATIDKSLPNTKTEIEIPGEDVIVEEQEKFLKDNKVVNLKLLWMKKVEQL